MEMDDVIDMDKVDMIDKMSLEDLKTYFNLAHRQHEDMDQYVLRIKE